MIKASPVVTLRNKCVVLGKSTAGKTALLKNFTGSSKGESDRNYVSTTAVQIYNNSNFVDLADNEKAIVELVLLDTPSVENLNGIVEKACKNLNSFILIYDCFDAASYSEIHVWHNLIRESFGLAYKKKIPDYIAGILVANKVSNDSASALHRVITEKQGMDLAESLGLKYLEIEEMTPESSKTPFNYIVNHYVKVYEDHLKSL